MQENIQDWLKPDEGDPGFQLLTKYELLQWYFIFISTTYIITFSFCFLSSFCLSGLSFASLIWIIKGLLYICHSAIVTTSASYSGDPMFNSQPTYWLLYGFQVFCHFFLVNTCTVLLKNYNYTIISCSIKQHYKYHEKGNIVLRKWQDLWTASYQATKELT
jgi:hypothetical protein